MRLPSGPFAGYCPLTKATAPVTWLCPPSSLVDSDLRDPTQSFVNSPFTKSSSNYPSLSVPSLSWQYPY